jgi:hypothetical protein
MLSIERQKEVIRQHLVRKFGNQIPEGEAGKYSVNSLQGRPEMFAIFIRPDPRSKTGYMEEGTEWWEGGIPGAVVRPADITPDVAEKMRDHAKQFLGRPTRKTP